MKRLNTVGEHLGHIVFCKSGNRTSFEQWQLRMLWIRGAGNLAAPCCTKYAHVTTYTHRWVDCGKDSWSNHSSGKAVDCGIIDKNGNYHSIGDFPGARAALKHAGLCLPVNGEAHHVERGDNWGNN
jgi:hypothetical protein